MNNIFANIKIDEKNEDFLNILKHDSIRIERIVSNGQVSEEGFWYEQVENEFIIILEGSMVLEFENKEVLLNTGDYYNIKINEKHRVKYTSISETTICLAVFYKD